MPVVREARRAGRLDRGGERAVGVVGRSGDRHPGAFDRGRAVERVVLEGEGVAAVGGAGPPIERVVDVGRGDRGRAAADATIWVTLCRDWDHDFR